MGKTRRLSSLALISVMTFGLLVGARAEAGSDEAKEATSTSLLFTSSCGAIWQGISSPSLWPSTYTFNGISAAGPNDVWLVGSMVSAHYLYALSEHWDGTEWRRVPTPQLYPGADLYAVLALGANDAWAAGRWITPNSVGVGLPKIATLILHWDGTAWRVVPSPNDPALTSGSMLAGLSASGPADIWAIGQVDDWSAGRHGPLILHWDGARWATMPTGDLGAGVKLYGVATAGPGDAWVVGDATGGGASTPLIAHWDGHTWSRRADAGDPGDISGHGYLSSVAVVAPDNAWAVGVPGLIRHWDGHAWSAPPDATHAKSVAFGNQLYAVAAAKGEAGGAQNDVWAVGGGFNANPLLLLATLHWDGVGWSAVPNVTRVDTGVEADHLTSVTSAGRNDFWAVGGTLIAHYADPCAAGSPPSWPYTPVADPHDPTLTYFPLAQHTLRGLFRDYWQQHGGLAQFGYPLTEQFSELNPTDGKTYTVQYFERNRFELHKRNADSSDAGRSSEVLLGLLGRTVTAERAAEVPFQPAPAAQGGGLWFSETGHNLAPEFAAYWHLHGGLPVYGYPISEAFEEKSPTDGNTYLVQYFERNRLEYHPELAEPFRVSLGLLGMQVLQARGWVR